MKRLLASSLLLLSSASAWAAGGAVVHINGMVCAFCANGIEKTFKKESAVDSVAVSLEEKTVKLSFKDKSSLSDEKLRALITDAGYSVVKIERN